jgi:hypothetical protein
LSIKVESSQRQLEWRRSKVAELDSQGHSQPEISRILQVSIGTVNRDLSILRQQAKDNLRKYIDEKLPHEYQRCLTGLTSILKEAWTTAQQAEDKRERIQALSLAKECYSMKLDLLTNATVVDDAIRFVASSESEKSKEKLKSSGSSNEDDKESSEPDYNEDTKSDNEGEEKQEEETIEIAIITTANQVF